MQSVDDEGEKKVKGKTGTIRQNEKLYTAEGILNPKKRKADKKKRKKASKAKESDDAMDDDDDYNFSTDYKKKGAAMDVSDDGDDD